MSWCDKLASVPGAGFRIDPHFASSDALLDSLSPLLDPLFSEDKQHFNVLHQQSFELQFGTDAGFNYAIEPTKIGVTFKHRMKARPVSAGPPVMEMISRPMPFTQHLPEVTRRLIEAAVLLPGAKTRTVTRIGIISTTLVAEAEMPPGIARFVEYVGRPWGGDIENYNITVMANLGKGPGYSDRCIHTIMKPEDKDQLLTLTFDWQRLFTSGSPISVNALNPLVDKAEKAALKYFEDVGEGTRFDEKLIREAAGV